MDGHLLVFSECDPIRGLEAVPFGLEGVPVSKKVQLLDLLSEAFKRGINIFAGSLENEIMGVELLDETC